jgi:hypothetical protein
MEAGEIFSRERRMVLNSDIIILISREKVWMRKTKTN